MLNKRILYIVLAVACILLIPFIAMRFTNEVAWTAFDFIFASALLLIPSLVFEYISRRKNSIAFKAGLGLALIASVLLVWINGAVGIIGSEDNPANLMYLGVLSVGIIGAFAGGLQAQGLWKALLATAIAEALVTVIALVFQMDNHENWQVKILAINWFFVMLWTISALLFRHASQNNIAEVKV